MVSKILRADGVTELASIQTVTYHESVNADIDLRPGCVASSYIEVTCFGAQSDAPAVGEALTYYQVVGETETLIGIFYAEPSIPTKNSYSFIAYDAVHKLDADFSSWLSAHQENFPYTVYQLVSQACTLAGVTLGSATFPESSTNINAFYTDGLTCRNIMQYAAEIGCKFVRCHTDGKVYFDWYTATSNQRIYPSSGTSGSEVRYAYKQDGLNYDNYSTSALARVAVHPVGEDDVAYIQPPSVTSGNTLNITNNLLLYGALPGTMNAIAGRAYTAITAIGTYRPMTVEMFPNECPFSAGQIVPVTDAQGVSFNTIIMEKTVTDSAVTLTSTGREVYGDYALDTAKQLVQLAADIVRINKLKVGWAEIDEAVVGVLTSEGIIDEIDGANKEEQLIYKTVASGTSSVSPTTTWITNTADQPNTWTKKRPSYDANYPVLFVATQRKAVDGTITCTTPLKDDNSTTISGGQITTGTIDASRVTVENINASNITTGALTVRDANNNIIFQADASNKNVQIGGWYANKDYIYSSNSNTDINSLYIGRGQIIFKDPNGNAKKDIVIDASKEYVSGKWQNRIDAALYNVYEGDSSVSSDYSIGCVINDLFAPHFSIGSHFDGSNITSDIYFDANTVTIVNPSAWLTAIGLGAVTTNTTISDIIDPNTNRGITITMAQLSYWGKFAQLWFKFKSATTQTFSSLTSIGTIKNAFAPSTSAGAESPATAISKAYINNTDKRFYIIGSLTANTEYSIFCTYILT